MGKAYFISDLHLGAPYFNRIEAEQRFCSFLESIREDVEELYLLGDILDYWYEYRYVVPRGYVRFFGKLAELADSGVKVTWFIGNHDIWIFDYIPKEIGVTVIDGEERIRIMGKVFFLSHGDGLIKNDWKFNLIRGIFRNRFCQILYSGLHPRWTIPFATAWSRHSRENGLPPESAEHPYFGTLLEFSESYLKEHPEVDYFVYGHLHVMKDVALPQGSRVIVLGDWIHWMSYGVFDGETFSLLRFRC